MIVVQQIGGGGVSVIVPEPAAIEYVWDWEVPGVPGPFWRYWAVIVPP
jgi:hypothetical protein